MDIQEPRPKRQCRRDVRLNQPTPPPSNLSPSSQPRTTSSSNIPSPLLTLPLDVLSKISKFLRAGDVKSLRLASLGTDATSIRDPILTNHLTLTLQPFESPEVEAHYHSHPQEALKWLHRPKVSFASGSTIRSFQSAVQDNGGLDHVEDLYLFNLGTANFLYRLGTLGSLKNLYLHDYNGVYRKSGDYPTFVRNLESLYLVECRFSMGLLRLLEEAHQLKSLKLIEYDGKNSNLKADFNNLLRDGLPNLEALQMSPRCIARCLVSLDVLSTRQNLKSLALHNLRPTFPAHNRSVLGPLIQLVNLEELCLSNILWFNDQDLQHIGSLTSLKRLSLFNQRESLDADMWPMIVFRFVGRITCLAPLINLEELTLINFAIDDPDLVTLSNLTKLKSANLHCVARSLQLDVGVLDKLKELSLDLCMVHNANIVEQIGKLTMLESLKLSLKFHRTADLTNLHTQFSTFSNLTKLKSLTIVESSLTNDVVKALGENLPCLEELSLWDCEALLERSISHLRHMKNLKNLTLHKFDAFTESGLSRMKQLKSVEVLKFLACEQLSRACLGSLQLLRQLRKVIVTPYNLEESNLPENILFLTEEEEDLFSR